MTLSPPMVVLSLFAVSVLCGCGPDPGSGEKTGSVKVVESVVVDSGPARVEIGAAKAMWRDESVVQFEIPYKFTAGAPRKTYQWRITFPGSKEAGMRPTEAWEMKTDGVQKTGIQVGTNQLEKFSVELYEAEAPDRQFQLISNTFEGSMSPFVKN